MLNYNKQGTFNHQKLTDELRAVFGNVDNAVGCVTIDGGLTVIVPNGTLEADVDTVIAEHNPSTKTDSQTKEDSDKSALDTFAALPFDSANPVHLDLLAVALKAIISKLN